ncbi:hypothetical protein VTJ49DRAFT_101 [Mycothermus thermophilus]|uniref:Uncharacterized protein n=1 Tax=Humicola insolens TaxID=85995 RepID=A0ABR3VP73_HUMIN
MAGADTPTASAMAAAGPATAMLAVAEGSSSNASIIDTALEGVCEPIHIPTFLLPPLVFTGLLVALWTWKCFMMVVFQNKIIYMPFFPPTSRSETIENWESMCGGIKWVKENTLSADGKKLSLAVATVPLPKGRQQASAASAQTTNKPPTAHIYVLYFQGNAGSIPPRLPDISWVLHAVGASKVHDLSAHAQQLTFVCLSYRGYWTSRGRPSEPGLRLDAEAGVRWIAERHEQAFGKDGKDGATQTRPILLVWGQSIGSGVATNLAATGRVPPSMPVRGLLLETPFVSIKAMLQTLYPQKWLPYRYLGIFLRNHLDSWTNLGLMAQAAREKGTSAPMVYILEAERDELVPKEQSESLYQRCQELGIPVEKGVVPVAFHQQAIARGDGKKLAAQAILKLAQNALDSST